MVQLKQQSYASYVQERFALAAEGQLADFISRRDGALYLGHRVDLNQLARRFGAPLEVVYLPQITRQVHNMLGWAEQARAGAGFAGAFLYAYATKANFAAEVVQTALEAGAHYETSAAADVQIARYLWQQGVLPRDRLIFCNGSKEPNYLAAIRSLRLAGCANVVPVLDDLAELDELRRCAAPFQFGVRERAAGNRDGSHPGNNRFGLARAEIEQAARTILASKHQLVLYHAMIGSQVEDEEHFLALLRASLANYCRLRQRVPTLRYFNFGGGVPTSGYQLGFSFDYERFLRRLMEEAKAVCAEYVVPVPDLIGEFGRYTVANHSALLLEVGATKTGEGDDPDWYLLNGSMMVSALDAVLVEGQEFIMLPLEGWDEPSQEVRLGGRRTCDSDDFYPRPGQAPLVLPASGAGTVIALCGIGAYQQMIGGRGGAHHCLAPEPARLIISEVAGKLVERYVPQQDQATIMRLLGYQPRRAPVTAPGWPEKVWSELEPFPARVPVPIGSVPGRRRIRPAVRAARPSRT